MNNKIEQITESENEFRQVKTQVQKFKTTGGQKFKTLAEAEKAQEEEDRISEIKVRLRFTSVDFSFMPDYHCGEHIHSFVIYLDQSTTYEDLRAIKVSTYKSNPLPIKEAGWYISILYIEESSNSQDAYYTCFMKVSDYLIALEQEVEDAKNRVLETKNTFEEIYHHYE